MKLVLLVNCVSTLSDDILALHPGSMIVHSSKNNKTNPGLNMPIAKGYRCDPGAPSFVHLTSKIFC